MAEVSNQTSQLIPTNKSLGLIETPENSFSNDLQISDRYQTFSAEMLRLALLGIAAIGFIVVNILLKDSARSRELIVGDNRSFMWFMSASLVCLGVSAAFSLAHRYLSTDSLACHLRSLRLEQRNSGSDGERLATERTRRKETILVFSAHAVFCERLLVAWSYILSVGLYLRYFVFVTWGNITSLDRNSGRVFFNLIDGFED